MSVNSDPTTTMRRDDLIEMFLDGTPGEVYAYGRLATRENDAGMIELVAYGENVLATVDPAARSVELYTGHHGQVSPTTTRYIKRLGSLLNEVENRDVRAIKEAAPTLGYGTCVSEAAQFITNYFNFNRSDWSDVEQDAYDTVNEALAERINEMRLTRE